MILTCWLMVLALLQVLPVSARGAEFPWKPGDAPPPVAGIHLGDGRVRLEAVLGQPSGTEKLGEDALALTYRKRGVQVLYAPLDGAAIIYLLTRTAGDIGGIRLGDTRQQVPARWGDPPAASGPMGIYRAGDWGAFVKLSEDDKVKQLGIGRLTDKAPEGANFYRKTD
ncbi:MAG: hypothetical protein NTY36_08650 [Deltaproteobacteria bacterium]|nr:hypothetical protein [Deltaproteobacteria bacterium]